MRAAVLVAVFAGVLSLGAVAEPKKLLWSAVTEDTNNDAINIDKYFVFCGDLPAIEIPGSVTEYVLDLPPGPSACYVTAEAVGIMSDASNVATFFIPQPRPKRVFMVTFEELPP